VSEFSHNTKYSFLHFKNIETVVNFPTKLYHEIVLNEHVQSIPFLKFPSP
jgi:hypothetical protein